MMQRFSPPLLLLALLLILSSCGRKATVAELTLVPEPLFKNEKEGTFAFPGSPKVSVVGVGQNSSTVRYIMQSMRHARLHPRLVASSKPSDIRFEIYDTVNPELSSEGYLLEVRTNGISVRANTEQGLFYGYQTLVQMLPPNAPTVSYSSISLPECTILDRPRFALRGVQLDASHVGFSVKDMRRWVDLLASYKMNQLWLNLPSANGPYSPDELSQLVRYAAERWVNVVPHLCDTLPDSAWYEQIGLEPTAEPIVCHTQRGGLDSARAGMPVAMSPDDCFDLARYQSNPRFQPTSAKGITTLATTYAYDLAPLGTNTHVEANIRGGLARMSTALMDSPQQAEYMLLPRLLAVSECLWSPRGSKNWTHFRRKVEIHKDRLESKGYSFCEGSFTPQFTVHRVDDRTMNVAITTEVPNTYIFYTTDLSTPTRQSAIYLGPIHLQRGTHIKILPVYKGQARDSVYEFVIK